MGVSIEGTIAVSNADQFEWRIVEDFRAARIYRKETANLRNFAELNGIYPERLPERLRLKLGELTSPEDIAGNSGFGAVQDNFVRKGGTEDFKGITDPALHLGQIE